MSDNEYTPTTADIRADYYPNAGGDRAEEHAEFDRWLARFERGVAEKAWDEAVASMMYSDGSPVEIVSNANPYRGTPEQEADR